MPSTYQLTLQFNNDYKDQCRRMHYLVARQKELCTLSKNMLAVVSKGTVILYSHNVIGRRVHFHFCFPGAQMGLKECQNQFSGRRWNCSTQFDATVPYLYQSKENKSLTSFERESGQSLDHDLMLADSPIDDVGDVFGGILKFRKFSRFILSFITSSFIHILYFTPRRFFPIIIMSDPSYSTPLYNKGLVTRFSCLRQYFEVSQSKHLANSRMVDVSNQTTKSVSFHPVNGSVKMMNRPYAYK